MELPKLLEAHLSRILAFLYMISYEEFGFPGTLPLIAQTHLSRVLRMLCSKLPKMVQMSWLYKAGCWTLPSKRSQRYYMNIGRQSEILRIWEALSITYISMAYLEKGLSFIPFPNHWHAKVKCGRSLGVSGLSGSKEAMPTSVRAAYESTEAQKQNLESGCHLFGNRAESSRPEGAGKLSYFCTLSGSAIRVWQEEETL